MGKVINLASKESKEEPIFSVYEAIDEYTKQSLSQGQIYLLLAGSVDYYNTISEVHELTDLPEDNRLTVCQMIERSGEFKCQ
jgi:hypothetical protein